MQRVIYHGSNHIITKPKFGFGNKHNDYGLGFYCTEDLNLAKEWAVSAKESGYANCYTIDEKGLNICDLREESFTCLHWLEILLQNRIFSLNTPISKEAAKYLKENFYTDISDADVLIGYRADDSYFSFAMDFLNNTISVGQLKEALVLGKLGFQYVLKSRRAFNRINFVKSELASSDEWYPKKKSRDIKARQAYFNMDAKDYIKNDLYMIHILDQKVRSDDLRLR